MGCTSHEALRARVASRAEGSVVRIVTRYRPTRHVELIGGSLYWIIKHQLVGRQEILRFAEAEDRRCVIELQARLVPVLGAPKRAHQGWRYLPGGDAPADLGSGSGIADLPEEMLQELSALALV